jgi:hypothetical protein
MKLGEITKMVVDFLRSSPSKEFTANTLLLHLGLPAEQKRRLYDVIEVLACAGQVTVRKDGRKRYFQWIASIDPEPEETMELHPPENSPFNEAGTVLHVLLHFNASAFQELSNEATMGMIERDIKRAVMGANAVSIIRIALKNSRGRILKQSPSALPATV